jgi:2,4-dienoyl-CoA reductase-like NADH-dependent reductase (Old Yellow Enzyme family)
MEATAVVPEGRSAPEDAGLWTDSQIAPLQRIVDFAHTQAAKVGVQLGHAGRKVSIQSSVHRTHRANTATAFANEGGWPDNGALHILSVGFVRCSAFDVSRSQSMGLLLFLGRTSSQSLRR